MASKEIRQQLEQRIADGEWGGGEALPSEAALVQEYGVARATVHKAMQELARDGLILTRPGKRAVVTRTHLPRQVRAEGGGGSPGTLEVLGQHLARALAMGTLRVDALCVTSESLVNALETQLIGVRARRDRLREFQVRLLLCDFGATPTYPRLIDAPEDGRPLDRLRNIGANQVNALVNAARSLATYRLVDSEPVVEVRTVPFPPMAKLYVLNEVEVVEGWYELIERDIEVGGHSERLLDVAGLSSRLFARHRHPVLDNHVDSQYVDAAQEFFDSWWGQAEPYGVSLERLRK